ncbi:hypothetical protein [Streptomyces erythrochromogenes]|uniref:hypothetical protein n=1 Tax=Streptomyces erythrochromogenes TaxID=285574 RepID=UPI002257D8B3|nr:hypothetical protein [Streptomyces erythrochromogenes]MCX5587537.1 hypothetical protein [Streptomyces erythrochromogenes]
MAAYPTLYAGQKFTALLASSMLPYTVYKAADESVTSSTTLQDDNHLILPLAANATYTIEGGLFYDGQFNAGNLKMTWSLPSLATIVWSANGPATGGAAAFASNAVTSGNISIGTYGTGGSKTTASISATVTTFATAGNMTLRWAQDGSHATATTIYAGSWLRALRTS